MLSIAGQTAGPIGLNFFVDTQGWEGGVIGQKEFKFFKTFFFPRAKPGSTASIIYIYIDYLINIKTVRQL